MKTANCLGFSSKLVLAQVPPLISQRNPELPDIGQIFAMHRINNEAQCPLTVRCVICIIDNAVTAAVTASGR
jgi:hypothetical protein